MNSVQRNVGFGAMTGVFYPTPEQKEALLKACNAIKKVFPESEFLSKPLNTPPCIQAQGKEALAVYAKGSQEAEGFYTNRLGGSHKASRLMLYSLSNNAPGNKAKEMFEGFA